MLALIAVAFTVLLGFGALAVDQGVLYVEQSRLQTALDAGVLAGAAMLPDTAAAREKAVYYIEKNGVPGENVAITFENGNMVITAAGIEEVDAGFSAVFGRTSNRVSNTASAEKYKAPSLWPYDYLLFCGDPGYTFNLGGRFDIGGSVHANGSVNASPGWGRVTGAVEACNTVYCNQWTMTWGTQVAGADHVDMPDFTGVEADIRPALPDRPASYTDIGAGSLPWEQFQTFSGYTVATGNTTVNCQQATINGTFHCEGNLTISGKAILAGGNTLYVDGDLTIGNQSVIEGDVFVDGNVVITGGSPVCVLNGTIFATGSIYFGNSFTGSGNLFAGDDITFTGGGMQMKQTDSVCVYSREGDIYMVTGDTTVNGVIYAPKGNAQIQGNNTKFYGALIAWRITGIPANLVAGPPAEPPEVLNPPTDKVRLLR